MNAFLLLVLVGVAAARVPSVPAKYKFTVYEAAEPSAKQPIGKNAIRDQPIIGLIKGQNGLVAYLMENGLNTLVGKATESINNVNNMLRANNDNTALIFNPATLVGDNPAWQQVRDLPIAKFEAPEYTRVANLARVSALDTLPIVMFFEGEDFNTRNFQQVANMETWKSHNNSASITSKRIG